MLGYNIYKVQGHSMSPTLATNDYVLCTRWSLNTLRVGQLVVVVHPRLKVIIKRVKAIDKMGRLLLLGDNPLSISTQSMGWVEKRCVLAKVIFTIPVNSYKTSSIGSSCN